MILSNKVDREFFIGLPENKIKGYCEPPQGDVHNSIVVDIRECCVACPFWFCHMFLALRDHNDNIIGRVYNGNHEPEY